MKKKTTNLLDTLKSLYAANYKEGFMLAFKEPVISNNEELDSFGFCALGGSPNDPYFFTGNFDFLAGGDSRFSETRALLDSDTEDAFDDVISRAIEAIESNNFKYDKEP